MKFFMKKSKDAGHRVTINIPKTTINNAIFREYININKKTNVNGFRKGKTPIKVIQEKYGNAVYYDVFKQLMQKFFYEFINKEKIKIIGSPKYYIHEEQKTEHLEYSVIYELYPSFQIKDIKNITAKKITVKITNEDVKKHIKKYQVKKNIWNTAKKPIKYNDRVTINYSIYEKNKLLDKFNTENMNFIVSKNTLIPQLNYKIINHYINDVIFFTVKFHSLHPEKNLQNKDITFKIKIIKVEEKQEELEQNNQEKIEEIKVYNSHHLAIKNNLNTQIKKIAQKYLEDQIIKEIIKKNIILIPPILFQEEVKFLYRINQEQYKKYNHNILEKKYHIDFDLQAKKRLYMRIIVEKIISNYQLSINEKNIQLLIKKISLNYKNPMKIVNLYNKNEDLKNTLKNIELEKQAMSILEKKIQILKEYWTFDQFINYDWKNDEELIT